MACQANNCPLKPRGGVGHNGACHCLDGLTRRNRVEVRKALAQLRAWEAIVRSARSTVTSGIPVVPDDLKAAVLSLPEKYWP